MSDKTNEINMLNNAVANGDFDKITVFVQTDIFTGEFGPNLESIHIDWDRQKLVIEDSFSEINILLGSLINTCYDDEMECWNYSFYNGVVIVLNEW
jgi:hypothetical protein